MFGWEVKFFYYLSIYLVKALCQNHVESGCCLLDLMPEDKNNCCKSSYYYWPIYHSTLLSDQACILIKETMYKFLY